MAVDTRRLTRALQRHTETMADTIPGPDARAYRIAAAWVYASAVAAWAADHGLTPPRLRADAAGAREDWLRRGGTDAGWLALTVADLAVHPAAWDLLNPAYGNPLLDAQPGEDAARQLLDWWAGEAPPLAHDTRPGEPATIRGYLPGDLLQLLTDERRRDYALAQSPWWLADFLLDRTLPGAARDHRDETLLLVDPTCGTGHVLVRAVEQLWELYTTGALPPRPGRSGEVTGWTPVGPAEAARRILAGVDGVELDPLTAVIARLRVTVTIAHLLHGADLLPGPLRLASIPHTLVPRIAVGDALLAGKVTAAEYARARPTQAAIINLGTTTASGQGALFTGAAA